jgi:hypothetical protein
MAENRHRTPDLEPIERASRDDPRNAGVMLRRNFEQCGRLVERDLGEVVVVDEKFLELRDLPRWDGSGVTHTTRERL